MFNDDISQCGRCGGIGHITSLCPDLGNKRNRTIPEVMLDWSGSRNTRRARIAREYWDDYESGRPMDPDDH